MGRKRKIRRRSFVPVRVVAATSYIDTMCIVLPKMMEKGAFKALRLSLVSARNGRKGSYLPKKYLRPDGCWVYMLYIHQPTSETLNVLAQTNTPYRISEVHVALDLLTHTRDEAADLQRYIEGRLLKNARPQEPMYWVKRTAYLSRGTRRGVEVAIYSDKPTKTSSRLPCLHIEWRTMGAAVLKKKGLIDVRELYALNHEEFWNSRLRLHRPPSSEQIERQLWKQQVKAGPGLSGIQMPCSRKAKLMIRLATDASGNIVAHDLLFHLKQQYALHGLRPNALFTREPHSWMLPPPWNALWMESAMQAP